MYQLLGVNTDAKTTQPEHRTVPLDEWDHLGVRRYGIKP